MDVRLWFHLLVTSSIGLATTTHSAWAQTTGPAQAAIAKSSAYSPKMRPDLGRKKIVRPAPGSRAENELQRAGVLPQPVAQSTLENSSAQLTSPVELAAVGPYQRPAVDQAAQLEALAAAIKVVPANAAMPAPSPAATHRAAAQRAPFIADRGPLKPAAAVQRSTLPTRLPQPVVVAKAGQLGPVQLSSVRTNAVSTAEFVAAPLPVPTLADSIERPSAAAAVTPVAALAAGAEADSARTSTRVIHTITAQPEFTNQLSQVPALNAPREMDVANFTAAKIPSVPQTSVAKVDTAITPQRQIQTAAGTLGELAQLSFPEFDGPEPTRSGNTAPGRIVEVPTPAFALPALSIPELPLITPPVQVLQSPSTTTRPTVEFPDLTRPGSAVAPTESSKLALPIIPPHSEVAQPPATDILLAELQREFAEMQAARDQLKQTVHATDMQSREVAARTNVAQAAQLQTLVTQVITKVRADEHSRTSVATQTEQSTRIVSGDDLPTDFVAIGSRLYSKGKFEDAEVAFRTALDQAQSPHDRAFANYLLATSLRRQSQWDDAARYYRVTANQSDEPELRDLARWQLKNIAVRKSK